MVPASARGKLEINLEHDSLPEIVVESGRSGSLLNKLALYTAWGVPEL
jgi:hypothetical protein